MHCRPFRVLFTRLLKTSRYDLGTRDTYTSGGRAFHSLRVPGRNERDARVVIGIIGVWMDFTRGCTSSKSSSEH